jgi:hypothetical protein
LFHKLRKKLFNLKLERQFNLRVIYDIYRLIDLISQVFRYANAIDIIYLYPLIIVIPALFIVLLVLLDEIFNVVL